MYSNSLILVVGGDPADRETILQALGDEYHVVSAQTLDDALAHMNDSICLVICDLESNRMNGMDLIRQWKAKQPETPFIAITGSDVAAAVEAMKMGVADCVVKPIDEDDLRSAAMQLANESRLGGVCGSEPGQTKRTRKLNIAIPPGTSLEDLERAAVEQALRQHHGNRTHAAKTLGISVRTLQRKLKAWGMPIVSSPGPSPTNGLIFTGTPTAHHLFGTHVH
jgi:DNA-binding NtrC family response regulator